MASHHLEEARRTDANVTSATVARIGVLEADLAMAADDYDQALTLAEQVLLSDGAAAEVRCHAFAIVGRSQRSMDLSAGRTAFENALVLAESADLPVWRMRGAIAERLGLGQVRAKALAMMTGSSSMRADLAETERYAALTLAAGPEDEMLEGFCWGMRGMAHLLAGDADGSIEPWSRGMAILGRLPHAEPAALRALWPLVLAARGDRRAQPAIDEAHRLGVATFRLNRAMVRYAEGVLAGRRGDQRRARDLIADADTGWMNCDGWADLARLLAAPAAVADGWADPGDWLNDASAGFTGRGLPALARQCRELLRTKTPNPWSDLGASTREADVLRLVGEGWPNKEIAARLHLSPRTVEKHVELPPVWRTGLVADHAA